MHRPAQRDQHEHAEHARSERRQGRRGPRLRRLLVCAVAVPAVLVAAGCSSDSGSDSNSGSGGDAERTSASSPSTGQSASADTVEPAVYKTLPEPCSALSGKTLGDLVPKGAKSGKEGPSDDTGLRTSCSWTSLENNGVKGSQYRWLNVSLLRFESDAARGAGGKRAQEYYTKQVQDVQAVDGAKNVKAHPVDGVGDEATAVRYDQKKKEGAFKQQTVVARTENVVVTLDYNGAGMAGDKTPNADDLAKAAEKAAKEAVAAVATANKAGGTSDTAPSKGASKDTAKEESPSASKSAKD
ncbi:DUF3558 domain-containing protein [Streptomyces sp. RY43-2]|uniref:DUF3558 domain-containing protein n=1 Tax=Streptomyces macrolidinus TaxID=2952607 RepID=A0ABT0ZBT5_9ACTN|nr:DUF3558 domain-containing protein [Streptomyces macrolidinus]MCN9241243.1 DUF3558 domain-containing protein [Streptomyces macrolidinus]